MASLAEKIFHISGEAASTVASFGKVALRSRPIPKWPQVSPQAELVMLGNGPSLRDTIDHHSSWLRDKQTLAVNFAANTPDFFSLKPDYYVVADPHFQNLKNEAVARLWENLRRVDWEMTLCMPTNWTLPLSLPANVRTLRFNLTPIEGFRSVNKWMYDKGMGMPRPRNVLIPSLMVALRLGFKKIYLAGADHSWTRTLAVDEHNRVVSIQPHFYKDDEKEQKRVDTEYAGYHLHDILRSLTVAFSSYFEIADYAAALGAEIVNVTPGSFIDAFPRIRL